MVIKAVLWLYLENDARCVVNTYDCSNGKSYNMIYPTFDLKMTTSYLCSEKCVTKCELSMILHFRVINP